jgi:5-methylcytosine-specific restriction endonuclease McrA
MRAHSKGEDVALTQHEGDMVETLMHYDGPVISRDEAKALGATRYFDGQSNPCRSGHVSERLVSSGKCVACAEDRHAKWRATSRTTNLDSLNREREKTRARVAAWSEKNPDKVKAKNTIRRERNPDSFRLSSMHHRARKNAADGSHTLEDIRRIHAEQDGKCACCGTPLSADHHIDHIMPLVLGGSNWPDNLQALCEFCNISKNAKHPLDFCRFWFRRHGVWPLFAIARGWNSLPDDAAPLIPTGMHSRGN